MSTHSISIPHDELAKFCQRHYIRQLSLFGSILRDDFHEDSDVDVLVEFEEGHTPGLRIITLENELSQLFGGRKVDMVNPKYLNAHLKKRILDSAKVQYSSER
ncbi:MAG: nucleotidyltransferase family protein [Candidatus Competibacteraceae bacterium]